jgi:RNA polymerase sigma-70 factor, ECF subfamily
LRAIVNGIDEQLLVEAAQRDPSRFAELYECNFERVYSYVARRVQNRDEAEDVTAEVFHQALANLGKFEWRGAPFIAWLLGIAANVLGSRWCRNPGNLEIATDTLEEHGVEGGIEQRTMLGQLVESLPPDQRHVIIRRFVERASTREIAKELARSEGAVKQLQFRALQTLRAQMKRKS